MNFRTLGVLWMLCGTCVIGITAKAQDKPVDAPHPVLVELEARLKPFLRGEQPETVTIKVAGTRLMIRYLTKSFVTVKRNTPDPVVSTTDEEGADDTGLLVNIDLLAIPTSTQVTAPLEVGWPNWATYYQRYSLVHPQTGPHGTQPFPNITSPKEIIYVDMVKDYWVYDATLSLSKAGLLQGHTYHFSIDKPSTRYDFAIATLYAMRRYPSIKDWLSQYYSLKHIPSTKEAKYHLSTVMPARNAQKTLYQHYFVSGISGPGDPRHYDPYAPPTQQQLNDAFQALGREFSEEIKWLTGGNDLLERGMQSAPVTNSQQCLWLTLSYGEKVNPLSVHLITTTVAKFADEKAALSKPTDTKKEQ